MDKQQIIQRAKAFIYKNGRLLDRKRFEYYFEGGTKEAVLDVLRAYQNRDGGFGNALEPDIRDPHSQPVPTEMALELMAEMDAFDPQIVEGICRYLREITLDDGGIPFVLRSVNDYPHAPWWSTDNDHKPSINPTGNLIGLLYKQNVRVECFQEDWFASNVEYIWRCFQQEKPSGFHDGIQWITFLEHTPDQVRASEVWSIVDEWLSSSKAIELDLQAEGYVHRVLDWAPEPNSYARKFVSDEDVQRHLKALAAGQQEDGGWPINWPAVSPAGEQEWRGFITIQRLKTLKSYGVL
jgi:hypothetical protein